MCIDTYISNLLITLLIILVGRLGGGSGVCEYISCPLGFLFVSLECLWLPLGRLWGPFSSLWFHLAPFGVHLVPIGIHLAAFVPPPFGCLWGALGSFGALGGLLGLPRGIF